jgi:uncharacterized protein (TIGR03435 family)
MKIGRIGAVLVAVAIAAAMVVGAQTSAVKPVFEVASVKPFSGGQPNFGGFQTQPGGRFTVAGVTLQMLINFAYRVQDFQIVGKPDWASSDQWEVVAKAEEGSVDPIPRRNFDPTVPDKIGLMVQSLLEQQFKLKTHRDTKELPTYDLISTKTVRLPLSKDQSLGGLNMSASPTGSRMQGNSVPVSYLTGALALQLGRTVVDKTGLPGGFYDFKLEWMPGPSEGVTQPPDVAGPSIFTAVQEQLGLRLVSSKGPVPVLVIDSVRKPGFH